MTEQPGNDVHMKTNAPLGIRALLLLAAVALPTIALNIGGAVIPFFLFSGGMAASAVLFLLTENPAVFLTAIPAYLFCWLLSDSLIIPLYVFLGALGAFTMASAMRRGDTKTSVTVNAALVLGAAAGIILCAQFYEYTHALELSAAKELVQGWFVSLKDELMQAKALMESAQPEITGVLTEEVIDASIQYFKWMVPALCINLIMAVSYLSVSLTQGITRWIGCPQLIRCKEFVITMSPLSAVIYTIAFAVLTISDARTATISCLNLVLLLAPGLFIVGWKRIAWRLKNARSPGSRIVLLLFMAMLLLFHAILFASCVVLIAVWSILFSTISRARDKGRH